MTPHDLFTKAAAAREIGVTQTAVKLRIKDKGGAKHMGGVEFVTRAWIAAWKAERQERARKLMGTTA